jgi:DNA-binding protein WhiA
MREYDNIASLNRTTDSVSSTLEIKTEENFHLMKALPLIRSIYGVDAQINGVSFSKSSNKLKYTLKIPEYSPYLGRRLMILDNNFNFIHGLSISLLYQIKLCDTREMLKALFLFNSGFSIKDNGPYGKKIRLQLYNSSFALSLAKILKKLEINSIFLQSKSSIIFFDDHSIEKLLTLLECEKLIKYFKNDTINISREDSNANILRSNEASEKAIRHIEKSLELQEKYGYSISQKLIDAVQLRLKYRNATLSQLGSKASPPLSKDAIASRIRRFINTVNKLNLEQ